MRQLMKLTKRQLKLLEIPPKCAALDCDQSATLREKTNEWNKYCSQACAGKWNSILSREKTKQIWLEKYGVENPLQDPNIFKKARDTMTERYGVEFSGQSTELLQKQKDTMIKRYGVEHAFQHAEFKEKRNNTMLERYGVIHALHNPKFVEQAKEHSKETELLLHGLKGWRLEHLTDEQYAILQDNDKLRELINTHSITSIAKLLDVSPSCMYQIFKSNNISIPYKTISALHQSVIDFIRQLVPDANILLNDHSILGRMELDVLLPEYKLALECNGSYWHSETKGKSKYYHLTKSNKCKSKNIKLLHIWEHEWLNYSDILKSIISKELNKFNYIDSQLLTIKHTSNHEEEFFLKETHLEGYEPSNMAVGLYQNADLLSLISFSQTDITNSWKIVRYATKLNININNGYNKIFSHFIKTINPDSIIASTQKHISDGKVLSDLGFKLSYSSEPSKFYIKHSIKDRVDFYSKISQPKNINSTIYPIWDCGSDIWKWIKS